MQRQTKAIRRCTGITVVVIAAVLASWLAARQLAGPTVRRAHTEFLFAQFEQAYADFLRAGNMPVTSEASFRDLIPIWGIDWNSCELRDGAVMDSWGTEIRIRIDSLTTHLRSAGPDRLFETSDDILREVGKGPPA